MSAHKHTQQDWLRDGTTVYALNLEGSNRFSVRVEGGWTTQGRTRTQGDELVANARLIAAAPELLEALRLAMEWNWLDDDARPSRVAEICDAAIAKATGEPA